MIGNALGIADYFAGGSILSFQRQLGIVLDRGIIVEPRRVERGFL